MASQLHVIYSQRTKLPEVEYVFRRDCDWRQTIAAIDCIWCRAIYEKQIVCASFSIHLIATFKQNRVLKH